MRAANAEVSRDNPEMYFVTVFAGILDLATGELAYCNAGHDNPYVLDAKRQVLVRLDQGAGPPLCTVENFAYASGSHRMQHGDLICLVTDGVADAQNPAGDRYGSERLRSLLARARAGGTTARSRGRCRGCRCAIVCRHGRPRRRCHRAGIAVAGRRCRGLGVLRPCARLLSAR